MTLATLGKRVGLEQPEQRLPTVAAVAADLVNSIQSDRVTADQPEDLGPDLLPTVAAAAANLVESIRNDTLTVGQIDSFLQKDLDRLPEPKKKDAHEFLLCTKAGFLVQQGQTQEGLETYAQALRVKETPSSWSLKGTALLQVERLDEAFDAFRRSYFLKEEFGPQKQGYLQDLLAAWSIAALLRCLSGILEQDVREAEKGAFEYIALLKQAREDGLDHLVLDLAVELPVADDVKAALEELDLMVRLLSIKDPFERWRAFTREISKVWPENLSAVDEIREQRDQEWIK